MKDQIPNFAQVFKSHIDTDAEAHIDAARTWLKNQRDKIAHTEFIQKLKNSA